MGYMYKKRKGQIKRKIDEQYYVPVDDEELLEDEDPDVELPEVMGPGRPPGALGGIFLSEVYER